MKNLKTLLIILVKIVSSLGIFAYLFYTANTPAGREAFAELLKKSPVWGMLIAGFAALLAAVLITMVRWCYLVRALGIELSLSDAFRIGFIGSLFNLVPMGIVAGDLLKAWILAHEKPGNRGKALASVIVDRIIGLYVLLLVASAGIFLTGIWNLPDAAVHGICWTVLMITAGSSLGIAMILIPGFLEGPLMRAITRIPVVGPAIDGLLQAILIYRSKRLVLFMTSLMTVPVHCLLSFSLFFPALGLGFGTLSWIDYFAIYPISGMLQTIPLPAGPTESGIVFFYKTALLRATNNGVDVAAASSQGLILALLYRMTNIMIAPIGAVYYFLGGRKEVQEVMHDEEEHGDGDPLPA